MKAKAVKPFVLVTEVVAMSDMTGAYPNWTLQQFQERDVQVLQSFLAMLQGMPSVVSMGIRPEAAPQPVWAPTHSRAGLAYRQDHLSLTLFGQGFRWEALTEESDRIGSSVLSLETLLQMLDNRKAGAAIDRMVWLTEDVLLNWEACGPYYDSMTKAILADLTVAEGVALPSSYRLLIDQVYSALAATL